METGWAAAGAPGAAGAAQRQGGVTQRRGERGGARRAPGGAQGVGWGRGRDGASCWNHAEGGAGCTGGPAPGGPGVNAAGQVRGAHPGADLSTYPGYFEKARRQGDWKVGVHT